MKEETKLTVFCRNMNQLCNSGREAEDMNNEELMTALCDAASQAWPSITQLESAIVAETQHRIKHPFTWRIQRWWTRRKSL
jgi:hypothetical protein